MAMESTQPTSCQSAPSTHGAAKRSSRLKKSPSKRRTRVWQSDAEYIADQNENSSWSSVDTAWGDAASLKFVKFGEFLEKNGSLCHDDKVADFGGNDGRSAFCFYQRHKIKPLVVDCEPQRLKHAAAYYGMETYQTFIEDMSQLKDKSIDWGFCSHTLEHTRDTEKAVREIARVVKRGCYFVLPLENLAHARGNHAHAICFTQVKDWKRLLQKNGWVIKAGERVATHEAQFYAEPA